MLCGACWWRFQGKRLKGTRCEKSDTSMTRMRAMGSPSDRPRLVAGISLASTWTCCGLF
jgi:hypothetical protein